MHHKVHERKLYRSRDATVGTACELTRSRVSVWSHQSACNQHCIYKIHTPTPKCTHTQCRLQQHVHVIGQWHIWQSLYLSPAVDHMHICARGCFYISWLYDNICMHACCNELWLKSMSNCRMRRTVGVLFAYWMIVGGRDELSSTATVDWLLTILLRS